MYERIFKRVFDIVLSSIGLMVLSPFFVIIGIIIFIDDPGPIFFKQKRIGKNKEIFLFHKFRSMKVKTPDVATHLLDDPDKYLTKVGKIIRKLSIDELPQLYDILRGKMSFVGPRPALWNQYDLIAERDKYGANALVPGLTGWAQINGRDELSITEKAKFDGEYVQKISFRFDLRCFFLTMLKVANAEGVYEGNQNKNTVENEK